MDLSFCSCHNSSLWNLELKVKEWKNKPSSHENQLQEVHWRKVDENKIATTTCIYLWRILMGNLPESIFGGARRLDCHDFHLLTNFKNCSDAGYSCTCYIADVHQSTAIPYREKKTLWNFLQENNLLLKYDAPTDPTNGVFSEFRIHLLEIVKVYYSSLCCSFHE